MLEGLAEQILLYGGRYSLLPGGYEERGVSGPQLCTLQPTIKHKLIVKSTIKANIIFLLDLLFGH